MIKKRTIAEVDVRGKRVLMRVDFNVPVRDGQILDDLRLVAVLESIRNVISRGGRLVLLSHLGRPGGHVDPELSLRPCAVRLGELLGQHIHFHPGGVDENLRRAVRHLNDGDVLMAENLRFHEGEALGDEHFIKPLAEVGDIYCNEAFGTAHRKHASMLALPRLMGNRPRVAGLLMSRELRYLRSVLEQPRRPLMLVLGGVRVADRMGMILHLLDRVDMILIGGAMAYPFLAAEHKSVGNSVMDREQLAAARHVLHEAGRSRAVLTLPHDHVCGKDLSSTTLTSIHGETIPAGWIGLDIGPRTVVRYTDLIRQAGMVFWTGPMGVAEIEPFDVGTKEIALALVHATLIGEAVTLAGGAATHMALRRFGLQHQFSHLTTGGTATLALLEGQPFPCVELLDDEQVPDLGNLHPPHVTHPRPAVS